LLLSLLVLAFVSLVVIPEEDLLLSLLVLAFVSLVVIPEGDLLLSLPPPCHSEARQTYLACSHPVEVHVLRTQSLERNTNRKRLILILLLSMLFFFCVFSPEITCQAHKWLILLQCSKMRVACLPRPIRYTGYIDQIKASWCPGTHWAFRSLVPDPQVTPLLGNIWT
jgi:hypothetical protein